MFIPTACLCLTYSRYTQRNRKLIKTICTQKNTIRRGSESYCVVSLVPISDENSVVTGRFRKRNRDPWPAKDPDTSETTSSLVKSKRREVIETTNLIFDLEDVCEVLSWRNGACCSIYTIFVRISSVLNSIPDAQHNRLLFREYIYLHKTY